MQRTYYKEMLSNLDKLIQSHAIQGKKIYLFGHCNATEELADALLDRGGFVTAILDNNPAKHGKAYGGIAIVPPEAVLVEGQEQTVVCIAARAYEAMAAQLGRLGYAGQIKKMVDYNSYAEYSLSEDTIARKKQRVESGSILLHKLKGKYPDRLKILCPFSALGDICLMMSYLPYFLKKRKAEKYVIGVVGDGCAEVARMFGAPSMEVFAQKEMDETIQAALYTGADDVFIPHQDRPYVVNLPKALYIKCIPLEQMYRCGVFGLPDTARPYKPSRLKPYRGLGEIRHGHAVILSPYAKSVTMLKLDVWAKITDYYLDKGFQCFTNVSGDEEPLPGTLPISPPIPEMQSAVEKAGTFIGIRSGLCDVLKYAKCRKVALYPDYNYCDTRWKAIDIYKIEGWENIVVEDGFQWEDNF